MLRAAQVARRFLDKQIRLDKKLRAKVNAELEKAGLDGNGRFEKPGLALAMVGNVLARNVLEFDEITNAHTLQPDDGRTSIDLALSNPEDPYSPTSISDVMLAFSWHKLQEYRYEAIAYIS